METVRLPDAAAFLERAGAFLLEREAEHNLILGLAERLRDRPHRYGDDDPYFALAEDDGRVVAAALRTPPYPLVLSEVDDLGAMPPLAADARAAFADLRGVNGPREAAAAFAGLWGGGRIVMRQRIYRAAEVLVPDGVPGRMRPFAEADRTLAVEWYRAFVEEAGAAGGYDDPAEVLARRLEDPDSGLLFWEDDGRPVSFAGYGGPTANGIRIGPVYTPPELRRRGYASALTAELTRQLLEGGRRFCFLFTDLANPTSNSIYQQVGYRPVSDFDQWELT